MYGDVKSGSGIACTLILRALLLVLSLVSVSDLQAERFYVDTDSAAGGDGTSWVTAYRFLNDAIDQVVAGRGDEIWLAEGVYYTDEGAGITAEDRTVSFLLKDGLAIYGGFGGTENNVNDRNPDTNTVVLSGKISLSQNDWAIHVCDIPSDASVSLDGVTVEGGNANDGVHQWDKAGGGVYARPSSSIDVEKCIFRENRATSGGGVSYSGIWSVRNSSFVNNSTAGHGGVAWDGEWEASNCEFINNVASNKGGVAHLYYPGDAVVWRLDGCLFQGNSAEYGGVISVLGNSNWDVTNCVFKNNTADHGGVAYVSPSSLFHIDAVDCIFTENSAVYYGGVAYYPDQADGTWESYGCLFDGNSARDGGVFKTRGCTVSATSSIFNNNTASRWGGVFYDSRVFAKACLFSGNTADSASVALYNNFYADFSTFSGNISDHGGLFEYLNIALNSCIVDSRNRNNGNPGVLFNGVDYSGRTPIILEGGTNAFSMSDFVYGSSWFIDESPSFVNASDPDGLDDVWGSIDDGFRLRSDSPAIDLGNSSYLPSDLMDMDNDGDTTETIPFDLAGFDRIQGANVDLGAYEYGNSPEPLLFQIGNPTLPDGMEMAPYQVQLDATNGAPPYRWAAAPKVAAWGRNTEGQSTVPSGVSNVVQVAGGSYHTLALRADGSVAAWGKGGNGETLVPPSATNVVAVSGGANHSLALCADGTVVVWGSNMSGQTNVPAYVTNAIAVSAGWAHNLALLSNGTVVGWGRDDYGQSSVPANATNVISVSGGLNHSLALRGDGTVAAWGRDNYGQSTVPIGLSNVVAIAAGTYNNLALHDDGTVTAWGRNNFGQSTVPSGLNNVVAVSAGDASSLALRSDGSVVAWGYDEYSQSTVPSGLDDVVAISSGWYHNMAVRRDGTVVLWGLDDCGQADLRNVVALDGGWMHTIALRSDGAVLAWGLDDYGQCIVPGDATNAIAVAAGFRHSLALREDGSVVAWGRDSSGQSTPPVGLGDVIDIAAGASHSLALRADGTVAAWGSNSDGQSTVPSGLVNVKDIAARRLHSIALCEDGSVVAWGSDTYGETSVPPGLSNVVEIAAGWRHNLALLADGTIVAWGEDHLGQCTGPMGQNNVVSIAAGDGSSLALLADGTVKAWGRNNNGERDVPAALSNVIAITSGYYHNLALCSDDDRLPPGLSLSMGGELSGTPELAGTNNVLFVAYDTHGEYADRELPLVIEANPNARPVVDSITPDLALVTVPESTNAVFTVTAHDPESAGLSYEWTLDGSTIGTNQASYSYVTDWGDVGEYSLRCYVSDDLWSNIVYTKWNIVVTDDRDSDGIPDWWEWLWSNDFSTLSNTNDYDRDGMSDYEEWISGTCPTDSDSFFAVSYVASTNASDFVFEWRTISNRLYSVFSHTNLTTPWPSSPLYQIQGDGTQKSYTNDQPGFPRYFRLGVELNP